MGSVTKIYKLSVLRGIGLACVDVSDSDGSARVGNIDIEDVVAGGDS